MEEFMKTLRNLIMCFVLLCGAAVLMAQVPEWQWAAQAGGIRNDFGWSIAIDSEGNQYVTGPFRSTATFGSHTLTSSGSEFDYSDIFIAKLDPNGNWLWAVQAGSNFADVGLDIAVDDSSNVYVTGEFMSTATFGSHTLTAGGDWDMFVAKLDTDGNWLWVVQAGGARDERDSGRGIALDKEGNVYVTGCFQGTTAFGDLSLTAIGGRDIFVAKLTSSGSWASVAQAGGSSEDLGYGIVIDDEGNAYVTGEFSGTATFGGQTLSTGSSYNSDIFIAKLNAGGGWAWAVQAGGSGSEQGRRITLDGAGKVYVVGDFNGTATFGSQTLTATGGRAMFVAILDDSGNWDTVVHVGKSVGLDIVLDGAGNAYVTGTFNGTATFGNYTLTSPIGDRSHAFAAKMSPAGDWFWAVQSEGSGEGGGYCIGLDDAGNSYVSGYCKGTIAFGNHNFTAYGDSDIFVAKLGSGTPVDDYLAPQVASRLHDAWPNPFNKATGTLIKADIPAQSTGTLSVYNLRGQRVASYELSSGTHEINFAGEKLPAGIYFYSLQCGSFRETKKLVLLR